MGIINLNKNLTISASEPKCCCFDLEQGMKVISAVFLIHGVMNLGVGSDNLWKGNTMAWGDILMVPPNLYAALMIYLAIRNERIEYRRKSASKAIMAVNIVNTIILIGCVIWMIADYDSAFK